MSWGGTDDDLLERMRDPRKEPVLTGLLLTQMSRQLEYLEERGYLRTQDLPRDIGRLDEDRLEELFLGWIAGLMGRELEDSLRAKLTDEEKLQAAATKAMKARDLDQEAFGDKVIAAGAHLIHLDFGTETTIELRIRADAAPLLTNGEWSEEENLVRFSTKLSAQLPRAPIAAAIWTLPAADWQAAHLGEGKVDAEHLLEAVLWEASLSDEKRAAWRKALEALDPAKDLGEQLRAIRVTEREDDDEKPLPDPGAEAILEAIGLAGGEGE
jgi:hypothetical protein